MDRLDSVTASHADHIIFTEHVSGTGEWYGDGQYGGNTVEDNSGIFSLI